ncbi:MAG: M14 family zinc carboxypeptidase [Anaerolineae bacterium]
MPTPHHTLSVDADFPGGNIVVEEMDGSTVRLHQDLRDTEVWWFYWYFRARGAQGQSLTFDFTLGDVIGSRGPVISTDGGRAWTWLGREVVEETAFAYRFPVDAEDVRFAFAMPYVTSDLEAFLAGYDAHPGLTTELLCHTRKGRPVTAIRLGEQDETLRYRVLLTCRHHACESVASYVLEGLMATALSDTSLGRWLQTNVAFFIVPFVDLDGVEEGDQGKQRHPRDHNRDYDGNGLYPTTRAIRRRVPTWASGGHGLALDLHCPYIRGDHSEVIYCVGGPDSDNWTKVQAFASLLEDVQTGPLVYRKEANLAFGEGWNTPENVAQGKNFSRWAAEQPEFQMATTIETPYADVRGTAVSPPSARELGRDLAAAIQRYLEERA